MRRSDRRVADAAEVRELLMRAEVLRLGMVDAGEPYVLPVNFGYDPDAGKLFVHSAPDGRKLSAISRQPRVCFEVDECRVTPGERACDWTAEFASVIGYGTARVLEDASETAAALEAIVSHYSGGTAAVSPEDVRGVVVIEIDIEAMEGKRSPSAVE
jgi:nitroimidazol reductase NimA-like FMN-containing flavoprotein (pyridoxamine 5'-phosphate oxidase superfamily)